MANLGDEAREIKLEEVVKDKLILSMVVLDSMGVLRDLLRTPLPTARPRPRWH